MYLEKKSTMSDDPDQKEAVECAKSGKNFFLTGAGGTGKTYVIHAIQETLRTLGKDVKVTAMTGCASLLLGNRASTLHSWAGIGLGKEPLDSLLQKIRKSRARKNWLCVDSLIIDEISMMLPELLEKLDAIGRTLRKKQEPFGGIQVILVGDFFQLPPVSSSIMFLFESKLWKQEFTTCITLRKIHRQKDAIFQKILLEARAGILSKESIDILETRKVPPNFFKKKGTLEILPTLLFTRREDVETVNTNYLKKCEGEDVIYEAETEGFGVQEELVEKMDKQSPYLPRLVLRKGAQVMMLINKYSEHGIVNGSRGVVESFDPLENKPLVKFRNGTVLSISRFTWESDGVKRNQIPLRLAYAITIHKSQGATLDYALIEIGSNTFEYGQAYVALSRVKSLESLFIWDLDPSAFRVHPKVLEFSTSQT